MVADAPVLSVSDIHAGYGDIVILRGVDLALRPATMTAVIGANGAGKSTLLKTIFGLVRATTGRIEFLGQDVTTMTPVERLRLGIVLVPQGRSNFPGMTIEENLQMGAYIRNDDRVGADIAEALERFPCAQGPASSVGREPQRGRAADARARDGVHAHAQARPDR